MIRLVLVVLLLTTTLTAQTVDWAALAPRNATEGNTVSELATGITAGLATDRARAAALFSWVAHNIAYDVSQMEQIVAAGGKPKSYSRAEYDRLLAKRMDRTLKKRKGVCDNYSRLYQALCRAAGLECELIPGNARGDVMMPGSLGIGHAWNAVRLDGEWALVDCTWGAGSVSYKGKFNFGFKPAYFDPRPASLSYSHFPREARWQLLDEPVSERVFLDRPAIGKGFLRYNLYDLSYQEYELTAPRGEDLVLRFRATTDPGQLFCANYTVKQQIDCAVTREGDALTVTVPAKNVRNMVLAVLTRDSELLLSYRLRTR